MPTQPDTPTPKVAEELDYHRWREVVDRAQAEVTEKPVMELSPDSDTESEEPYTASGDAASAAAATSVSDARPKGDTPWTGEANADAVDAETVAESLANPASAAEKGARSLTPDPPWGNPRLRLTLWSLASAILLVAAVALIVFSDVASLLVALVAIVAVSGTLHGVRVSRLERRIAQTPNLEEGGSRLRRWLRRLQSP
jgi:hypothetical protein